MTEKIIFAYYKLFLSLNPPPFWKIGCEYYYIAKLAGSQKNNKSSKHDSITLEFCKKVCQRTYLNDFRLGILGKKKLLEKSQIG